jgi:hypothetical protein
VTRWSLVVGRLTLLLLLACSNSSTVEQGDSGVGSDGQGGAVCVTVDSSDKVPDYTWPGTTPTYTCNERKSTKYPDGPNACRNVSDCAIIATGMVREITRVCGLSCRSYEPDCDKMAMCNSDCVQEATRLMIMDPGISPPCGACYTGIALCSLAYCLSECAANADAAECVTCQFHSGCRVPFERCSGLDRVE